MHMKIVAVVALGIVLGGSAYVAGTANVTVEAREATDAHTAAHAVDAAACGRLTSLTLSDARITSAEVVEAGKFEPPTGTKEGFADLPAFCRVQMTIKPSTDSDIKSEIWLPASGWNGKFEEVGNG